MREDDEIAWQTAKVGDQFHVAKLARELGSRDYRQKKEYFKQRMRRKLGGSDKEFAIKGIYFAEFWLVERIK